MGKHSKSMFFIKSGLAGAYYFHDGTYQTKDHFMNNVFILFILILITTLPKAIGQNQDTISIENVNIIRLIMNRCPLHYNASYLGTVQVSISRIRAGVQ